MPTHTAPVKTARGSECARNQELQPRALVLVLTGAVHWQTRPRKRPQGLDKEHGILHTPMPVYQCI
jgi:hypothetical protein